MKIKKLVVTALFAALICVATLSMRIPSGLGGGYVNLGDGVVLLAAYILGPVLGGVAAGIGSCLADIFAGYATFAVPTLIIKFIMAMAAGFLFANSSKKNKISVLIGCGVVGEIIMATGYFAFETWLLKSVAAAAAGIYGNLSQAILGVVTSTALYKTLCSNAAIKNYINKI